MNIMNSTQPQEQQEIDLQAPVEAPSYAACVDWMNAIPEATSRTFDVWSRGNFIRRIFHNRSREIHPILVPAANTDQMKSAYRRLALVGMAVDFVYTGPISKPHSVMHLWPWEGVPVDAGWGYVIVTDPCFTSPEGRKFAPITGTASLMPESVTQWIAKEAYQPFLDGRLMVAPAELVGLSAVLNPSRVDALAQISGGTTASDGGDSLPAILDLEMPWIDGMSPSDFEKLLSDHQPELADFRSAFASLMSGYYESVSDSDAARERFRASAQDLLRSARHERLRSLVLKCRGTLTTFPVAMGALAAAGAISSHDPFAGVAVLASAGKVLHDLWKQARSETHAAAGPLRMVLRMGPKTPTFRTRSHRSRVPRDLFEEKGRLHPCHWLCPPTSGLQALVQVD